MKECINYKKIDKTSVQCNACNHHCIIEKEKTGICGIRKNVKNILYLLAYGKAVAAAVNPVEKKPLFHFLPGTETYSFGTIGCNFNCGNCQNYDISQVFESKGKVERYDKLNWGYSLSPSEIVEEALKTNCQSISYTFNEPTIWVEYALDTMKLAKEKGLKNIWVSNGYMSPETLDSIIPYLDAINIDIKSSDPKFYQKNCGAKLEPVLENCKRLVKDKIWLEVTTLVIPDISDDPRMLENIAKFIAEELGNFIPWHISAFFGGISWKMKNIASTPSEKIKMAYKIGKKEELKYVYSGNLIDTEMENTLCPKCQTVVIERDEYDINRHDLQGKCPKCGTKIEGTF